MTSLSFNDLPSDIQEKIYFMEHNIGFKTVMTEFNDKIKDITISFNNALDLCRDYLNGRISESDFKKKINSDWYKTCNDFKQFNVFAWTPYNDVRDHINTVYDTRLRSHSKNPSYKTDLYMERLYNLMWIKCSTYHLPLHIEIMRMIAKRQV